MNIFKKVHIIEYLPTNANHNERRVRKPRNDEYLFIWSSGNFALLRLTHEYYCHIHTKWRVF